jgi:hypothetical protein
MIAAMNLVSPARNPFWKCGQALLIAKDFVSASVFFEDSRGAKWVAIEPMPPSHESGAAVR